MLAMRGKAQLLGPSAVALVALATIFRAHFRGADVRRPDTSQETFMFVTPAYAQATGATPDVLVSILPFVLIFVIMYFLIIRPQRTQLKKRGEMLSAIRRGDTVVTGGGFVGKVTKVIDDNELEVDLGNGVKVTALRATISDVRVKGEPIANQNAKK
jgi:preprotein translocase subunit YajC